MILVTKLNDGQMVEIPGPWMTGGKKRKSQKKRKSHKRSGHK